LTVARIVKQLPVVTVIVSSVLGVCCARNRAEAWNRRGEHFRRSRADAGDLPIAPVDERRLAEMTRESYDWTSYWTAPPAPPQYERAQHAFEHAIEIDPGVPLYERNLGLSFMDRREPRAAAAAFAHALELDPTDPASRLGFAAAQTALRRQPAS
jgi:tetratricopeptide (TPR) repeat protein